VAAAAALSVFISPHGGSYDQVLLLTPAAVAIAGAAALPRGRRPLAGLAIVGAFVVAPWLLYSVALARGTIGEIPYVSEEWSALTPLLALATVMLFGARAATPGGRTAAS
jgi:hypothetical protein